jgi:class 3 adenylate cyclase
MTESRKLAAILAADVVGFSRLTGADEDRTLARLRALRSDLHDKRLDRLWRNRGQARGAARASALPERRLLELLSFARDATGGCAVSDSTTAGQCVRVAAATSTAFLMARRRSVRRRRNGGSRNCAS